MKNRLSAVQPSARSLVLAFCFACGGQTPPAEAPAQPEPAAAPAEQAPPSPVVIKDVGFQTPESIQHEPASDVYYLSNINGGPMDKDDNGFISKLSPDGKVLELKWIDGASAEVELHAPKGIGISAGKLYVTDIDVIRTFDLATGKPLAQIAVKGASFLNDVTVGPDGTIYVSDTGLQAGKEGLVPGHKDAIYKVSADGKLATLIQTEQLGAPNGLFADDQGLLVATWQGKLYRVTYDGKQEPAIDVPGAQCDGLLHMADGQVVVTSWEKSTVYLGSPDGQFSPLVAEIKSPADIGYDSTRGQVMVPLFLENAVQIHKLPQVASAKAEAAPASTTAEANK